MLPVSSRPLTSVTPITPTPELGESEGGASTLLEEFGGEELAIDGPEALERPAVQARDV